MLKQFITNTEALIATPLRRDALAILEAGLSAVDTGSAIRRLVSRQGDVVSFGRHTFDFGQFSRVFLIGFGKVSATAAQALEAIIDDRLSGGVVIDTQQRPLKAIESFAGTHPLPSPLNLEATRHLTGILQKAGPEDLVIVLVSGGGSVLLCDPVLPLEEYGAVIKELMRRGAPVADLNTIRKHLSRVHGGQLISFAPRASFISLVFSDIPGDDMSLVASAPTFLDPTTATDAARVLEQYGLQPPPQFSAWPLRETPKDPALFARCQYELVIGNTRAAEAMQKRAAELGYKTRLHSSALSGEARDIGRELADLPQAGEAVIAAGETTVKVLGSGRGGRNQEVALSALRHLAANGLVASLASDGIDNDTPAAGALADSSLLKQALELKLDPNHYLAENNSYDFFRRVGGAIITGKTGINVSDLFLSIRDK